MAIGMATGWQIYEANPIPGGICSSYYMKCHSSERLVEMPPDGEVYTFEYGGGHWLFGENPKVVSVLESFGSISRYSRNSSVYYFENNLLIPCPIQNNLKYFPIDTASRIYKELMNTQDKPADTMEKWLHQTFGSTLAFLFFNPFHELYTAGLYKRIAPDLSYKSPINLNVIERGMATKTEPIGYNATFLYPDLGMNFLVSQMAKLCKITYNKRLVKVDIHKKIAGFSDGAEESYDNLITTVPLKDMVKITGISVIDRMSPYTSVLVINVGGKKGHNCPKEHWLYIPKSRNGFYRIGFYSNISKRFLPKSARDSDNHISLYIEKSFIGGEKIDEEKISRLCERIIEEIVSWGFLELPEVIDHNWIEVAYTWLWPNDKWRDNAIEILEKNRIFPVGRYAEWRFKGMVDCIGDGFKIGTKFEASQNTIIKYHTK